MPNGFHIYHNFNIQVPKKKVFDAISLPAHLNNWWTKTATGIPELGNTYNLFFTPKYDWFGKVVICKPNQAFYIKMTQADPDWTPTTFGFDLTEENKVTEVQFSHENWPYCNDHFKHSTFSWALLLNGLKNYLERGEIVPFDERA